ncbi:mediator complex subunit Med5-domain-containing protein [Gigaspora rosea]|uniref:Mediator of RNA polymerase II transcription subunit 5 n=1 Tax=Gigaspora rosea TaxID=44941 RepID=A0A397V815_9GLOM|nr:mediator complex subunit Med5-domain-containing protein [Gigaspora rosea]
MAIFSDTLALPSVSIMFFVYNLVQNRPVMNDDAAVEYLEKLQRAKGAFDHVFYVELWVAALTGLAEEYSDYPGSGGHALLWKSFVLVKLPALIEKLEARKSSKPDENEEIKYGRHECVINQLSGFRGLFNTCNPHLEGTIEDIIFQVADISVDILKACFKRNLLRREFALRQLELEWSGSDSMEIDSYAGSILDDPNSDMIEKFVSEIPKRFMDQESRIETILRLITEWSNDQKLRHLSILCRLLGETSALLDIIHLYHHPSKILQPLEQLCNTWERSNNDDNFESYLQDCESFGTIFLFFVNIIDRYELYKNLKDILCNEKGFCHMWILQSSVVYEKRSLNPEKSDMVDFWVSAMSATEDIHNELIMATNPRILIELAPTIFKYALAGINKHSISVTTVTFETLSKNFEFFLKPYSSYALVGAIQWLCDDVFFKGQNTISSKVLKFLISSKDFPVSVARLVANKVMNILDNSVGSLPSVEDTETDFKLKLAAANNEPVLSSSKHPYETLFSRFWTMFKSIVYGGRQLKSTPNNMNIEYDIESPQMDLSLDLSWRGSHHLDISLFRSCLEIHGPKIFVDLIVEDILNISKKGIGYRAAELGASLITIPLCCTWNAHLHPNNLIYIFFSDALVRALDRKVNLYVQGQALGTLTLIVLITWNIQSNVSTKIGGKSIYEVFIEHVLPKFQNQKNDSENDITHHKETWSKLMYGPTRGFIDSLISNNNLIEEVPQLAVFKS